MKKKILMLLLSLTMIFVFSSCGDNDTPSKTGEKNTQPPDLTGSWKQVNSNSEESYQIATIQGDVIEVYWFDEETDTKSLYWAGTYVAPETPDEPYTWDSENDKEQTSTALLASGDDTKTFTYDDEQISYEVTALGTTQTVKLEKTVSEEKQNTSIGESNTAGSDAIELESTETVGQRNAISKAKSYLNYTAFSYSGLIGQLEYEGFSTEEATYGVDNCGADWNEQAAKKAQDYLDYTSFSRSALIDQLLYEGFTAEQAEYGVSAVGY